MSSNRENGYKTLAEMLEDALGVKAMCEHEYKLTKALCLMGALLNRIPGGYADITRDELNTVEGLRLEIVEHEDGTISMSLAQPTAQPTHAAPATRQ